jgi:hypothetical protein
MLVITAGSLMHVLIAIGLLFTVYAADGELVQRDGPGGVRRAGGPAASAGVRRPTSSSPSTASPDQRSATRPNSAS